MSMDDAVERLSKGGSSQWIGVYIGILAVLLALCGLGGGNAAKDATRANIEASNTWAFFQAKNLRRQTLRLQVDTFEAMLTSQPALAEAGRANLEGKLKAYRELDKVLTSDAERKEGLDQLFERGKALEKERDIALRRDPYFDWAQALLQIAVVLASISLITGGGLLIGMSGILAVVGSLMMLNGFTLAVALPLLG